ncbi:MAG: hypothetical protein AABY83_09825 [Pseudomonadota bacterium]
MTTQLTGLRPRPWLLALLLALVSVFSNAESTRTLSAHVVVQFTEGVADPNAPEFIENLAVRVGAPLAYVHPAGVNGHLILIRHLTSAAQFAQVMAALTADQQIVTVRQRGVLAPERR